MTEETFMKAMIPFEPTGDINSFEKKFMPMLEDIDLSAEEHRRNLISSIWIYANSEWSRGYKQGKSDPEFDDD